MIGSMVGLILGILISLSAIEKADAPNVGDLGALLTAFPAAVLIIYVLIQTWMLIPLQKAEQNTTPRILEMFKRDPFLGFNHLGLIVLPFFAIVLGLDAKSTHFIKPAYLLGVWLFLMGASIDLLILFIRRILSYLNPFTVVQLFRQAAKRSVQNDKEADLCEWIDALAEVGSRALDRGGTSLCNETLNELHEVTRVFLEASKSISHPTEDKQSLALGIRDKVTFTLFYLFQRLEMIYNKALEKNIEPVCSSVLTTFGKITIDAAKYDISLAAFPLQYIGKLAMEGHTKKLQDIGLKASCLYLELARSLLTEIDISYLELQEPFFTIIHHLNELAKESFKQNKDIPIKALNQPFYDLKALFKEGPASTHQDAPAIIADADRVIAEFDALEMVLRTIPPLPTFGNSPIEPPISEPLKDEPTKGEPERA